MITTVISKKQETEQKMKKEYEKPFIKKEESMNFPREIIKSYTRGKIACRQCSSCHSCR